MSSLAKAQSSAKNTKDRRQPPLRSSQKKKQKASSAADITLVPLPESIAYLSGKQRSESRWAKCYKQFEELSQLVCAMNSSVMQTKEAAEESPIDVANGASTSPLSGLKVEQLFPTLQVGYLARALGLNVCNKQVVSIVELVEENGPSTGFVDRRKLGYVLVDAMMTGTLGGPTLRKYSTASSAATMPAVEGSGVYLSAERLASFAPSLCVRKDEMTLLRAFEALDIDHRGYLEEDQIRTALMNGEESLLAEEVDIMWMAMCDPETNCAYYRDFAEILARE
ncbi:hypothetical protein JKF63_02078 [Porcisia hertigi]|uniref:EF-hand domain-containing protein n=1 Tax=Porcisia hertigi TaxID=2761500 RepID=A0A836ID40_9TRYP|nr:hypothetical protein JKF63_02078 [Porcisia hertigi]